MRQRQAVLLSIKPHYAGLIFEGSKKAELRRGILPSIIENCAVFVYVSSPVKQLWGAFYVSAVSKGQPHEIWNKLSGNFAIDKSTFDDYFRYSNRAYALQIDKVRRYKHPIRLEELRKQFPNFVAPQSWRYVKPDEYKSFNNKTYNEMMIPT